MGARKGNINFNQRNWLLLFFIIMWILFAGIHFFAPHVGDDLSYANSITVFSNKFKGNEIIAWFYYCVRHWVFSNGRLANYLASGLLYWFPQWFIAILNGFFWSYLGFIILKITKCLNSNIILTFIILGFIWLLLPWWDNGLLTDVALNYSYSSSLGLTVVYLFIKKHFQVNSLLRILLFLFSFIAGMMHEAMSLPLLLGFCVYSFLKNKRQVSISWKTLTSVQKNIFIGFGLGVLEVVLSPGIWMRLIRSSGRLPDAPFPILFLISDFLVIILFLVTTIILIVNKDLIKKLFNGPFCIFFVASIISAFFSGVSGIIGRSGWFAQIYSLICIIFILRNLSINFPKKLIFIVGPFFLFIILFCYISVFVWQIKRWREFNNVITQYEMSEDGTVYADYTDDNEIPLYTLGITNGVPDPDDFYSIETIEKYKGNGKKYLVLPKAIEFWDGKLEETYLNVGKGYVTNFDPSERKIFYDNGDRQVGIYNVSGKIFIVTEFFKNGNLYYFSQPLDLDWGDKL